MSFADPETHEPLVSADAATLQKLRDALREKTAAPVDGSAVPPFDGAYLTRDGRRGYLVIEGIPTFLVESRLAIDPPIVPGSMDSGEAS